MAMSATQRANVSKHMKAYWAKRREMAARGEVYTPKKPKKKVKAKVVRKAKPVAKRQPSTLTRFAVIGAKFRLEELDRERASIRKFLKSA